MGNQEWEMAKAIRPLPPHPDFMGNGESASPFPIPTIPHSRVPIPKGGVVARWRVAYITFFSAAARSWSPPSPV